MKETFSFLNGWRGASQTKSAAGNSTAHVAAAQFSERLAKAPSQPEKRAFQERHACAIVQLNLYFDLLDTAAGKGKKDGKVNKDDLRAALKNADLPEALREACCFLLENKSAYHPLQNGCGGTLSQKNVEAALSEISAEQRGAASRDFGYQEKWSHAVSQLYIHFDLLDTAAEKGKRDGKISQDDLRAALKNADLPEALREACRFLLDNPSAYHQLDAAGNGKLNGRISKFDVAIVLFQDSRNEKLYKNKFSSFLPELVLNSGNPDLAREFIRNSNGLALNWEIAELEKQIRAIRARINDTALLGQLATLTARRNALVAQAIQTLAQFDKYYSAALENSENPAVAAREASAKYNEWIFYHSSEGKRIQGPTTLFAEGEYVDEAGNKLKDGHDIHINDVHQEELGNCYFMAPIAAIAHNRPHLIEQMIRDNEDGTYTVTLYREVNKKAQKFEVTVDLTVPSNKKKAALSGDTKAGAIEVWPQVLEKAYAKYKGSYGALHGGVAADVFFALTGAKPLIAKTSKVSEAAIEKYLADKRPMVVNTCGDIQGLLGKYNLTSNHVHALIGMDIRADGQKYLILHNPWNNRHPKPIPMRDAVKIIPNFCAM